MQQKMFLQAFRTSIGDLKIPRYVKILEDPNLGYYQKYTNIVLLWALWYVSTFIMMVILLNFIIAVIGQTFERVKQDQQFIYISNQA